MTDKPTPEEQEDWKRYAGAALAGLVHPLLRAAYDEDADKGTIMPEIAGVCGTFADAMLAEQRKRFGEGS